MFPSSQINLIAFLVLIFAGINHGYSQRAIDSVFVNWNKATISSLEDQIRTKTDSDQRSRYENRLSAITAYWAIKNVTSVNTKSIRYGFLNKLLRQPENLKLSKFYIIEANESGSKVLLRNFVVYIDSVNNATIEFYINLNQGWQKRGSCQIKEFHLEQELKSYITPLWKGFNEDDIIVTRFDKNVVQESEFFLYGTLSNTSSIKKVLDCYGRLQVNSDTIKIVENDYKLISDGKYTIKVEVINSLILQMLKSKQNPVISFSFKGEYFIAKGNYIINSSVPNNCNLFYFMNKRGELILHEDNVLMFNRIGKVKASRDVL